MRESMMPMPAMARNSNQIAATRSQICGVLVDDSPRTSDHALAQAAAGGGMVALGDLYERHNRRVYALCLGMTHNSAEAEDLTQEVFIQLMRKIGTFRGESQFTTWLHRLTVNLVLMHFRRVTRRKELMPGEIEGKLKVTNKGFSDINFIDRIALNAALTKLPSGCRSVFLLFDIEGYKHEEIANI